MDSQEDKEESRCLQQASCPTGREGQEGHRLIPRDETLVSLFLRPNLDHFNFLSPINYAQTGSIYSDNGRTFIAFFLVSSQGT